MELIVSSWSQAARLGRQRDLGASERLWPAGEHPLGAEPPEGGCRGPENGAEKVAGGSLLGETSMEKVPKREACRE